MFGRYYSPLYTSFCKRSWFWLALAFKLKLFCIYILRVLSGVVFVTLSLIPPNGLPRSTNSIWSFWAELSFLDGCVGLLSSSYAERPSSYSCSSMVLIVSVTFPLGLTLLSEMLAFMGEYLALYEFLLVKLLGRPFNRGTFGSSSSVEGMLFPITTILFFLF